MRKLLILSFLFIPVFSDPGFPACTGPWDCAPQCGQNCAPPSIPCPQAGPQFCPGN